MAAQASKNTWLNFEYPSASLMYCWQTLPPLKRCLLAGTGKSFLLNQIVAQLKQDYGSDFSDSVAICASTGIAATHVGGTPLTWLSPIPLSTHPPNSLCKKHERGVEIWVPSSLPIIYELCNRWHQIGIIQQCRQQAIKGKTQAWIFSTPALPGPGGNLQIDLQSSEDKKVHKTYNEIVKASSARFALLRPRLVFFFKWYWLWVHQTKNCNWRTPYRKNHGHELRLDKIVHISYWLMQTRSQWYNWI